jgi:hypothetical protein
MLKIKGILKIPTSMKEILVGKMHISCQVYPTSLLGVSTCYCQRALLDESVMIRTQIGKHNISVIVAVYGTPCAIPRRKQ